MPDCILWRSRESATVPVSYILLENRASIDRLMPSTYFVQRQVLISELWCDVYKFCFCVLYDS
jgi:hypothetical protein